MKVLDLFCGAGGFSAGLRMAGLQPSIGVDIEDDALETYARNFRGAIALNADLSQRSEQDRIIALARERSVEVVVGGPPCQGYSGLNNHRNTNEKYQKMNQLPLAFVRIAIAVRPKVVIMEEVKTVDHAMLDDVERRLRRAGFNQVERRVLNSKDYFVPQSRNRMFLIATRSDFADGSLIPLPATTEAVTVREALSMHPLCAHGPKVTTNNAKWIAMRETHDKKTGKDVLTGVKPNWHVAAYGVLRIDKPAPTITTNALSAGSGRFTIQRGHDYYAMSEQEAARLQSFPPSFEFIGNRRSVYRQIGNSVPPLLAYHVGKPIKQACSYAVRKQ
jgi:DNA (cytosine-5)-methyltransferase 1